MYIIYNINLKFRTEINKLNKENTFGIFLFSACFNPKFLIFWFNKDIKIIIYSPSS